ncbi:MAG: hypothetical protein ACOYKF_04205, partial [Phenylobacterium sp.]
HAEKGIPNESVRVETALSRTNGVAGDNMYGNDYSVSWGAISAWLAIAALVGGGIALIRQADVRNSLLFGWYLFPAAAMTILCAVLYVVLPDDRYMSPAGGHWFVMLLAAAALALILTPPWALAAWIAAKLTERFRGGSEQTKVR